MTAHITKSKLMMGLRCPRQLWLRTHRPHLASHESRSDLGRAAGMELGGIARQAYSSGRLIGHVEDPNRALAETAESFAAGSKVTLFEPAFMHEEMLVRVDILHPVADAWRLVEVKSTSSIKPGHLMDCVSQLWVLEGAGVNIEKVILSHIDKSFVYDGSADYGGLLVDEDVTEQVRAMLPEVRSWMTGHEEILKGPEPIEPVSGNCDSCEFLGHCAVGLPEYPVSILPNGRKVVTQLLEKGITDVRDIPEGRLENERHVRVWQATRTMQAYISDDLVAKLRQLAYPRCYLDFESISLPIPRWKGIRPNQHVPFQWSCHVESSDGRIVHREFLATDPDSPVRPFARSLIDACGGDGPILVFGAFEQTILTSVIASCRELELPLQAIIDRLVDLLPMMREGYYHPSMKGSWSIKAILPTVAPHLDYANLEEVRDGAMAQQAFLRILETSTPVDVRERTIKNLLAYCERDTLAMVEVVRYFYKRLF